MRRFIILFTLLCVMGLPGRAKDFPFVCLSLDMGMLELSEEEALQLAQIASRAGIDAVMVKIPFLGQEQIKDVEAHLDRLDLVLPEEYLSFRLVMERDSSGMSDPQADPGFAGLSASQRCLARLGSKALMAVPGGYLERKRVMVSSETSKIGPFALFSREAPWRESRIAEPIFALNGSDSRELDADIGWYRQSGGVVCVSLEWPVDGGWEEAIEMARPLCPDWILIENVPAPTTWEEKTQGAMAEALGRYRSSYVPPLFRLSAMVRDDLMDPLFNVTVTPLKTVADLDVSLIVEAEAPIEARPERVTLFDLKEEGEASFSLVIPEGLAPGVFDIMVSAEGRGYRTVSLILHKIPYIAKMLSAWPRMDGNLGDWGRWKSVPMTDSEGRPGGKISLGWMKAGLFIALVVDGANLRHGQTGSEDASIDSVRIGIDTLSDQKVDGYAFDDLELVAGLGKRGPVIAQVNADDVQMRLAETQLAVSREGGRVIYEMALCPWENDVWRLESRSIIGVSVIVKATSAETGQEIQLTWGEGLEDERSPRRFNDVGLISSAE